MQIKCLSDEAVVDALKNGTRMGKLRDKITTKKSSTFSKVMAIATKSKDVDKDKKLHKKEEEKTMKR